MKAPRVSKKNFLVVLPAIVVLIGAAILAYIFVIRGSGPEPGSQEYLTKALDSEEVKGDLAEGSCSNETQQKLGEVDESADPSTAAKAHESLAYCLVYDGKPAEASQAYRRAAAAYDKASNTEMKALMEQLAGNTESAASQESSDDLPAEESGEGVEFVAE